MFSDGREVKSYQIGELVSDAEIIPHTMPHIFWLSGNRLDEESGAWLIASAKRRAIHFRDAGTSLHEI